MATLLQRGGDCRRSSGIVGKAPSHSVGFGLSDAFQSNAARRHHIPKQRFWVRNWTAYDAALRQRGSLTVWFSDEAVERWRTETRSTPGRQRTYSDLAITTALTLRAVYHLALRQTERFLASIIQLLDAEALPEVAEHPARRNPGNGHESLPPIPARAPPPAPNTDILSSMVV